MNPDYKLVQEGSEIEFEYTENSSGGKIYRNIGKVTIIKGAISDTAKPPVSVNNYKSDINASIELQVCFKGAVEIYKDKDIPNVDIIIEATKKFYTEIFQNRDIQNGDKSKETTEMVIAIMKMISAGHFQKDEAEKASNSLDNAVGDFDKIKKIYLNILDEFNEREKEAKKDNPDDIPY